MKPYTEKVIDEIDTALYKATCDETIEFCEEVIEFLRSTLEYARKEKKEYEN
jgi:hypothetical protein